MNFWGGGQGCMGKLVTFFEGKPAGEYLLDKERISIGRKAHNAIQLDHPTVSSEHALIITIRQDSFLEDLKSTNGTRVNHKPIKKCTLQDGDEIRIGKFIMKYFADPPGADRAEEITRPDAQINPLDGEPLDEDSGWQEEREQPQRTQVIDSTMQASVVPLQKRKQVESKPVQADALAALQILSGPGAGKELLLERALTTLGKPGVQVAVITRRGDGYFFTHVEGEAYPLINGRTAGGHSHPLKAHDIIELADTQMEFFYK